MKLKNPIKNKGGATVMTLIFMIIICCLSFTVLMLISCLLGRAIAYIKIGAWFLNWDKDLFYSLRIGISAGVLTGIGVWVKTKLQEQQVKKAPNE